MLGFFFRPGACKTEAYLPKPVMGTLIPLTGFLVILLQLEAMKAVEQTTRFHKPESTD